MDDNGLPPLPTPSDTVTPVTPPIVSDTVSPVTLSPTEPEKPKKKSNMKVVAGLVVALFLVGSAITSLVMFPNFRGDIRPKARDIEEVEQYMEQQTRDTVQLQTQEIPYQEVTFAPQQSGGGEPPPGDHGAPGGGGGCNQGPVRCWDGTEVNGCWGVCPTRPTATTTGAPGVGGTGGGPTVTVTSTVTSTPGVGGGGTCEGAQNASCCAGKSPGQVTCGGSVGYCTRGTSGCSFDFAKVCIPNECYHTGTGDEGRLCASDGLGYVPNTKCYANPTVWTCGCDLGNEAGSVGPQTCWNKQTGGSVKKEPLISGCKGSGTPSVTTTATATVTTTPGGGSSSGGSSPSFGGVTAMCVETRVYLKKADGTFDTVATPVSQLSSKVSIGNTIRLAIRGNLANFTKGRFIIKKDGTVLETKETTTKNNLPGDPATFEYIYDYTVASGGSYSIEGAVWQ